MLTHIFCCESSESKSEKEKPYIRVKVTDCVKKFTLRHVYKFKVKLLYAY